MKAYNVLLANKNKVNFSFKHVAMFLIILSALLPLSACNHVDRSNALQQTIVKVEKVAVTLSPEDWKKYDLEIEQTKQQLNTERGKYTPEETEKMNKLIGKYYALKATHKVKNLKEELKDASQQLEGHTKRFLRKIMTA